VLSLRISLDRDPIVEDYAIVIGNGPSLRGFDLRRLGGFDTLGMNAAYRHWDRIGWYPTHYCCLDDQLVQTHHAEIDRLYSEGLVKHFFLEGGFFELHPERLGNPAFLSFDQVSPYWHRTRGQRLGISFTDHPEFHSADLSKVTTGSYAIRYMAMNGHKRIALMGIDLKYVEVLPEARPTEGVGLIMTETPSINPNYFFDDYQQAGDRYNVPNPAVHSGDLHPRSFELLRDDFKSNGIDCAIVNTNPTSVLETKGIFPLVPIENIIRRWYLDEDQSRLRSLMIKHRRA